MIFTPTIYLRLDFLFLRLPLCFRVLRRFPPDTVHDEGFEFVFISFNFVNSASELLSPEVILRFLVTLLLVITSLEFFFAAAISSFVIG